jgi:CheY-like chemotaxis protein
MVAKEAAIDLVLIDIAMPELNGIETTQRILRERGNLPFLYMTGYVGPTQLDPLEKRVIKKPFTIAELAAKVEEVLSSREAADRSSNVVSIQSGSRTS